LLVLWYEDGASIKNGYKMAKEVQKNILQILEQKSDKSWVSMNSKIRSRKKFAGKSERANSLLQFFLVFVEILG